MNNLSVNLSESESTTFVYFYFQTVAVYFLTNKNFFFQNKKKSNLVVIGYLITLQFNVFIIIE